MFAQSFYSQIFFSIFLDNKIVLSLRNALTHTCNTFFMFWQKFYFYLPATVLIEYSTFGARTSDERRSSSLALAMCTLSLIRHVANSYGLPMTMIQLLVRAR